MHEQPHPQAGSIVTVDVAGSTHEYRIEDWWDRVSGGSWRDLNVIAAINYDKMREILNLPGDNEVVYGKIGGFGYLMHVSQIVT